MKLIKYDKKKTFMYPNGKVASPERVLLDYPACEYFTFVVTTDEKEEVFLGFDNLSVLRSVYKIDIAVSDEEAIAAIEEIMNTPEEIIDEPTAEERIAAALEYQNMASMEDAEVIE